MKTCSTCRVSKDESAFYKSKRYGLEGRCKACSVDYEKKRRSLPITKEWRIRESRLNNLKKYGLTEVAYEEILRAQAGLCAICSKASCSAKNKKRLSIDHDHETGTVRGLLCHSCNVGIGLFKEDVDILSKAIRYLSESKFKAAA